MERELMVNIPNADGEEGLSRACREGKLFRNDPRLEDLYKDGFRIYNYDVVKDEEDADHRDATQVRVFLKK